MRATVNIPFAVELNGPTEISYAADVDGVSCYAKPPRAKDLLREQLRARIAEALAREENAAQQLLGCADGTLLLIAYSGNGAWGYSIINREHQSSGGLIGPPSFADAKDAATRHAAESYGGVAWQERI